MTTLPIIQTINPVVDCQYNNQRPLPEFVSPLELAIESGNEDLCKSMIERVDVNRKTRDGDTYLHKTVQLGKTQLTLWLLEAGADVNARNATGSTPLRIADRNRDKETINILVQHGAKLVALYNNNVSLELSCLVPEANHMECISLLGLIDIDH